MPPISYTSAKLFASNVHHDTNKLLPIMSHVLR